MCNPITRCFCCWTQERDETQKPLNPNYGSLDQSQVRPPSEESLVTMPPDQESVTKPQGDRFQTVVLD